MLIEMMIFTIEDVKVKGTGQIRSKLAGTRKRD